MRQPLSALVLADDEREQAQLQWVRLPLDLPEPCLEDVRILRGIYDEAAIREPREAPIRVLRRGVFGSTRSCGLPSTPCWQTTTACLPGFISFGTSTPYAITSAKTGSTTRIQSSSAVRR
jgi:hypothetical protein